MFEIASIKIRPAKATDYWFVYNISKRNMNKYMIRHWGGWKPSVFRENFDEKNTKILEYKNKRIGFYEVKNKGKYLYIPNVQISTNFRGKGLGTRIMFLIEKEAKRKKIKKIRLQVFKDNPAKKLYLKLGYKTVGDKKNSLILEKVIENLKSNNPEQDLIIKRPAK